MTFVSPQVLANLAAGAEGIQRSGFDRAVDLQRLSATVARDRRARLVHILELLEAAVLSVGFDNSIGGCLRGWLTGTANPAHGGDTRRVVELSPRLSLRRAKTAYPEPTPANSLDRGSRK